jgi:hypothetical protein
MFYSRPVRSVPLLRRDATEAAQFRAIWRAMQIDQSQINELISRPAESLNVEIKSWINPDDPHGIAKIARAALALRNRNGGYLLIGFDDKTLQPDAGNQPQDVRRAFHTDKIQGIISRYSSELFEVSVAFGERGGHEYPVIVIPEGVRAPVAAKADLIDDVKKLITLGDVYFRTLASNGTPSTAPARPQDWRDIVEICFDNREADVGRFLRRQLAGRDVASLISALSQLGLAPPVPTAPSLRDRALALLNDGDARFQKAIAERTLTPNERPLVEAGSWSIALIVDPPHAERVPDKVFLATIESSNPGYTGWPIWLDSGTFTDTRHRPVVKDKAWEALILSDQGWSTHLDFSRFDPKGEFYLRRALQDDLTDKVEPETALDPILVVVRVAEAIAVGLAFATALGWKKEETRLGFAFRWTKLSKRELVSWANPMAHVTGGHVAHDNVVTTFTELSLDTPSSAIAPFVEQATEDLFATFNGYKMPSEAIEEWARRLVERRLNSW